jgi:hypothetical protein
VAKSTIRFSSFPRTAPPPTWAGDVVRVFEAHEARIATSGQRNALNSDQVLEVLRRDLEGLGFQVEASKKKADKIERPVFYGENGLPEVRYEIDAYHSGWHCGLEVEAGRGWLFAAAVQLTQKRFAIKKPRIGKFFGRSLIHAGVVVHPRPSQRIG